MAGDRIGKVTTRAGDHGKTKLATGRTIAKHAAVVHVIGAVDELNSHIGLALVHLPVAHAPVMQAIQQNLFDMGAVFAMEGAYPAPEIAELESQSSELNAALPPLTEFVLPGGGPCAAQLHVCRTICRRAESLLWGFIADNSDADAQAMATYTGCAQYLNRLSDYFFVLARTTSEAAESQWRGPAER